MNRKKLERKLKHAIECGLVIDYERETSSRYIVYVSAMFEDGDHPVVLLLRRWFRWRLTDEGNTLEVRLGEGAVEMSMPLRHDGHFLVDRLTSFTDTLLAVDAAMRKNASGNVPGADTGTVRAGKPIGELQ